MTAPSPDQASAVFRGYRDHFSAYHNHKEHLAYLGATLFIGAVGYGMVNSSQLAVLGPGEVRWVLFFLSMVSGFSFVGWQLTKREDAARMVQACTTLLGQSLLQRFDQSQLELVPLGEHVYPRVLVEEVHRLDAGRGTGARTSTLITLGSMTLWAAVAAVVFWG